MPTYIRDSRDGSDSSDSSNSSDNSESNDKKIFSSPHFLFNTKKKLNDITKLCVESYVFLLISMTVIREANNQIFLKSLNSYVTNLSLFFLFFFYQIYKTYWYSNLELRQERENSLQNNKDSPLRRALTATKHFKRLA